MCTWAGACRTAWRSCRQSARQTAGGVEKGVVGFKSVMRKGFCRGLEAGGERQMGMAPDATHTEQVCVCVSAPGHVCCCPVPYPLHKHPISVSCKRCLTVACCMRGGHVSGHAWLQAHHASSGTKCSCSPSACHNVMSCHVMSHRCMTWKACGARGTIYTVHCSWTCL